MALRPYDPVGAMGGLFAPAMIRGNRESELAFDEWMARNLKRPPAPDTGPLPPAPPTMEGAPPESAEEAAARQRDAIAKTIMMLQGGDQGSGMGPTGLAPGGYPFDANLDPNPHTGPPSPSASPTPPAIDRDNTPPSAPPPSSPPPSSPPPSAPPPSTDNRGVTIETNPQVQFGRALENMQFTPLQDPEQESIIDQQAPPTTNAPPTAPPAVSPVAPPTPPGAPQATPVPGMPMTPDITPVSPLVDPFGPVPGPNSPVPATPVSTLSPHVGPPPPAMDNLQTLTTPWGRGTPWGMEHTPQQAPPNPFTPVNTMIETILGTPNAPNPSNPFGDPPDLSNPYGGSPSGMSPIGPSQSEVNAAMDVALGSMSNSVDVAGAQGVNAGDAGMTGGFGGYGGSGGGYNADTNAAVDAVDAMGGAIGAAGAQGVNAGDAGMTGGFGGYGGSGTGMGNAGDAGLAGGLGGLDAAAAAAIGDAYGGGAPSGPSDVDGGSNW